MEEQADPPSKKLKLDGSNTNPDSTQDSGEPNDGDFTKDVDPARDKFMVAEDKYTDHVTPEELEKLREFQVLDEVKSDDEDSNEEGSESSDGIPEEEIEKMLEEDLPEDFKGAPKPKERPYIIKKKVVLEEKCVNQFEVLPLDWIMVRHHSGMPIYIHRGSRVCTLAKPYFLGKGNTRRHDIPISAIPCLAYRRALEEEAKQQEIDRKIEEQIKSGKWHQNFDKNKQNKATYKKTDSTLNVHEKTTCPYLHAKGIAQNSDKIPENHELLKARVKDSETNTEGNRVETIKDSIFKETEDIKEELTDKSVAEESAASYINNCDSEISKSNDRVTTDFVISQYDESSSKSNKELNEPIHNGEIDNEIDQLAEDDKENNENAQITSNNLGQNEIRVDNYEATSQKQTSSEYVPESLENGIENKSNLDNCETTSQDKSLENNENEDVHEVNNDSMNDVPLHLQPVVLPGGIVMPPPRVESVNNSWKTQHLSHEQVNEYCRKLFKFKTIDVMHFRRWADRRKYVKARKTLQYPPLPEGTKLITIPAANNQTGTGGKATKRDWVMNMNGRSYLSVFHEYVRRALQKQPVYKFKHLENAATPYQAAVYIGGMQYGVGQGSSKRGAKSAAARASIRILIPEMQVDEPPAGAEPDHTFFDNLSIEDPRITEFCAATCEPTPHAILRTCLLRNFGTGDKQIHTEIKKLEYQKVEFTMKVGKHTATVVCKNKKSAKQRASQAILQMLHPHVHSWGSLLRLYGSRSVKSCKEKKLEEQQITLLQDEARHNEPNYAVLEKLKNEMRKLKERDEAVVPIGTMLLKDDLPTHSGSNLNNVDL